MSGTSEPVPRRGTGPPSSGDPLTDVATVVRRVLAARSRDHHLVEDLTQETLVRVAGAGDRLSGDALRAYAIVTARNLLSSHWRSLERHQRNAPRLVERHRDDGPEQLAVQREETDALATALERLDAQDRDLLLAHETEGIAVRDLAEASGTSPGALAVRLARARATLRLEFVLALRNVVLPTSRCRPVLLALSTSDHRRQRALDAADHLLACPVCADLSEPLVERRRRLVGWAALPVGCKVTARLVKRAARSRAAVAVVVTGAVSVAVVAVAVNDRENGTPAEVAATIPTPSSSSAGVASSPARSTVAPSTSPTPATAASVPTTPATTALPTPATTAVPAPAATAAAPAPSSPLRLDDGTPLPAPGDEVHPFVDRTVVGTGVPVMNVSADEGFWVGTPHGAPMWILLVGPGESPATISTGQHVDIVGVVRLLGEDPAVLGLDGEEAAMLAAQGVYLEVGYDHVLIASEP